MIESELGYENKSELADIEKLIKFAKNVETKNVEIDDFIRAIDSRIIENNEAIETLDKSHKLLLTDILKEMAAKKSELRAKLLESLVDVSAEIEATDMIFKAATKQHGVSLSPETFGNFSFIRGLIHGDVLSQFVIKQKTDNKIVEIKTELNTQGIWV